MKKLIFLVLLFLLTCSSSYAQISKGDNLLGGSIGLYTKGNTPVLGVSFESHIDELSVATIGIGGLFRFHNYETVYSNGSSRTYSFTSLGFQTNFNFNRIGDGKFVPFIGLVLGYNSVSNSFVNRNGFVAEDVAYTSGVWIWGQLGARYFFSNKVAGTLRLGFGNNDFYPLEFGIDFKL